MPQFFMPLCICWPSVGRTKQLGTKERNWLSQRRSTEGQQMHRGETTPFSSRDWENTEKLQLSASAFTRHPMVHANEGMEPREDSCWWLPNRTFSTKRIHAHLSTCVSSQTSHHVHNIASVQMYKCWTSPSKWSPANRHSLSNFSIEMIKYRKIMCGGTIRSS